MRSKKVNIGASGWSYKDWKGIYYPKELKSTEWLTYYATQFDTTEINTSFYHLPKVQTVLNWVEKVPKKFRFCPKMSRYITHMKKLLEPEEPLQRFFDVFDHIKDSLGPVLVQLPAMLKYDQERVEHFFGVLHSNYRDYDFALEARHTSWFEKEPLELMEKYKIGLVISQSGVGFPYLEKATAKNIYVRFHGPKKLYASLYTDEMMEEYAKNFKKWIKDGHTIWAYFNNDGSANAIKNATYLKQLMTDK